MFRLHDVSIRMTICLAYMTFLGPELTKFLGVFFLQEATSSLVDQTINKSSSQIIAPTTCSS